MNLESLLHAAAPEDLLPFRRVDEAARVVRPWVILCDVDLGETRSGHRARFLLLQDARGVRFGVPAVFSESAVRRAVPGDGVSEALVAALSRGGIDGLEFEVFAKLDAPAGEHGIAVDQTNELVVIGDDIVVKWILHPDDLQPAPSRMAALARAGFTGAPLLRGLVRASGSVVAMVVDYVPDTLDGWEWAVDDVRSLARGQVDLSAALAPVNDVAHLIAEMHVALAAAGRGTATLADCEAWSVAAAADVDSAPISAALATRAHELVGSIASSAGTSVIEIHGDLHIGQVLCSGSSGYYVIDFDGNPVLSPADRMLLQPVARDVAGMLASLDHVGRVVLHRTDDLDDTEQGRVLDWIDRAQAEFLAEYRRTLDAAGSLELLDDRLIVPFQVQQECREYAYATRYLPHWLFVPDAALPALIDRESS